MAYEGKMPISERCWKGRQSWHYELIVNHNARKFRVTIKRDAYDFQCVARVDLWRGKWEHVLSLDISECDCKKVSYVDPNVNAGAFRDDAVKMLTTARQIVG
jgi:hypothetical protein